jgi:hypothetical protein
MKFRAGLPIAPAVAEVAGAGRRRRFLPAAAAVDFDLTQRIGSTAGLALAGGG